jgi:hypothetical protein
MAAHILLYSGKQRAASLAVADSNFFHETPPKEQISPVFERIQFQLFGAAHGLFQGTDGGLGAFCHLTNSEYCWES